MAPKANGEIVDVYNTIKMSALDIIIGTFHLTVCIHVVIPLLLDAAMGQQINALENSDQPYVKALDEFSYIAYEVFVKPFIKFPLIWHLGGYDKKTKDCLKTLKDFTEQVSGIK